MTHATKTDEGLLRCFCPECKGELAYRDAVRAGKVPMRTGRFGAEEPDEEAWKKADASAYPALALQAVFDAIEESHLYE